MPVSQALTTCDAGGNGMSARRLGFRLEMGELFGIARSLLRDT
jgi:hypothetical protein